VNASAYERARGRYQDVAVAEGYDSWRYETARGQRRNRRDLAAVGRAVDEAARRGGPIGSAVDLPCGTGRLVPLLSGRHIAASGADVSLEMLLVARRKLGAGFPLFQCSAAAIPLPDASCDAVFAIRFLFHLDREARGRVLTEMRRVARRWVVADFRHRYNFRYLGWRIRHALGLLPEMQFRFSRRDLDHELARAGLRRVGVYASRRYLGWFSDKWTVLAERA
jgi:ubiquinone/menaquinone biosynthesis C-methylase UbiE